MTWTTQIQIGRPAQTARGPFRVGELFEVEVGLGELNPDKVRVELFNGHMKSVDALQGINTIPMAVTENLGKGLYRYTCRVPCRLAGRYGFTVRAIPEGDDCLKFLPGLITWS